MCSNLNSRRYEKKCRIRRSRLCDTSCTRWPHGVWTAAAVVCYSMSQTLPMSTQSLKQPAVRAASESSSCQSFTASSTSLSNVGVMQSASTAWILSHLERIISREMLWQLWMRSLSIRCGGTWFVYNCNIGNLLNYKWHRSRFALRGIPWMWRFVVVDVGLDMV
jgi:hypothetical protein